MNLQFTIGQLARLIPCGLSCLACLWLFLRYFTARSRSLGFSMVFILAMSDFIFSASLGSTTLVDQIDPKLYYALFFISINFSIYWASGIALLVYKSLKDVKFNSKKSFSIVFMTLFLTSVISTIL